MTHLDKLTGFIHLATTNPEYFRQLWESICLAHIKAHNLAMKAKQPPLEIATVGAGPYTLTPEEREAEEKLNAFLADGGKASDRQFYKVLGWLETVDIGDAIYAKLAEMKKPANAN